MAGFNRRPKPLKARVTFAELGIEVSGVANGDTLIYDSVDGVFEVSKAFTGTAYTFAGSVTTVGAATIGGALTAASLVVTNDASVGGDLVVTDDLVADVATFAGLVVNGNATVSGTLTITGTLAFAGFSASGNGTIAGSLTVGTTLGVTGATTLASTLTVTGATTLSSTLFVAGNTLVGGTLNVIGAGIFGGAISGASLSTAGNANVGGTLTLGLGGIYTGGGITFFDDGTAVDIYNGTLLILSLDSASILEGTGTPAPTLATRGSLYLRTDGDEDRTLYVRGPANWFPVVNTASDIDLLMQDYFERQDFIITGSLDAGDVTANSANIGRSRFSDAGHLLYTYGRERMRVLSDGRVVITGNNAEYAEPSLFANIVPTPLTVQGTFVAFALDNYSSNGPSQNAHFVFRRSRSDTIGVNTIVQNGDRIGALSFQGANGLSTGDRFNYAAQISVSVSATPSGDMPGTMRFSTTPVGSTNPTARLIIDHTGLVSISAGGKLSVIDAFSTGAETATFTATNKPGAVLTSPTQWLTVSLNGTDYYIPCWL